MINSIISGITSLWQSPSSSDDEENRAREVGERMISSVYKQTLAGQINDYFFRDQPFLGTMAGEEMFCNSPVKKKTTYSRVYQGFGASDDLRMFLTEGRSDFKTVGEEYSYTPPRLRDGRAFGYIPGEMQGGGFFLTLKRLSENNPVTSFDYALDQHKEALEKIGRIPISEIKEQCNAYGMSYIIDQYYDTVDQPMEGDLVVYQSDKTCQTPSGREVKAGKMIHAGIYRESASNWNSPLGGSVESKWGWLNNCYVFQHDLFFTPDTYGNVVQFYRPKKAMDPQEGIEPFPCLEELGKDGHYHYVHTPSNDGIRQMIDQGMSPLPVKWQEHNHYFLGVCYHYAFGKILKTYVPPSDIPLRDFMDDSIMKTYFTVTVNPQPGDLVVYYGENKRVPLHYGVFCQDGLVESKWGQGPVFKHPPFFVFNLYGDEIVYYRLRSDLTPQTLLAHLKEDYRKQNTNNN